MIARFEPVDTTLGYDIREFDIIDWKIKNLKWLETWYKRDMELPIFKPLKHCKDRQEFMNQFIT